MSYERHMRKSCKNRVLRSINPPLVRLVWWRGGVGEGEGKGGGGRGHKAHLCVVLCCAVLCCVVLL